ncbi:MAG: hypothetical protein FH756_01755 [Firmicutes bacterium]|nr:hypothetical protein [Bacillota bacterium]
MYAYYHEHFEITNFDNLIRVTCVCGNDFIWSIKLNQDNFYHRCPHCNEQWIIGFTDGNISLTRKKTGASLNLWVGREDIIKLVK